MIDYELAKELKDAGFPHGEICEGGKKCQYGWKAHVEVAPTLSELIEAVPYPNFTLFSKGEHGWCAEHSERDDVNKKTFGEGTTPEIAVARLWLALNKKP